MRHGETDWNREGRLQGQRDIPLNGRGRDQAAAAGKTLLRLIEQRGLVAAELDFVASPLSRTVETMRLLRGAMGLAPEDYRVDDRLKELSFGTWEGRTWRELKADDPSGFAARRRDKWGFVPPRGESYACLRDRVAPWLDTVRDHAVMVGHGGVARVLLNLLVGLDADRAPNEDIWQGLVLIFAQGAAVWA